MLPIIYIYNLISMKMMQNGGKQNKKPTYNTHIHPPPPPTQRKRNNETSHPETAQ